MSEDIEKSENFDETIDREIISVQNIDFFDVDSAIVVIVTSSLAVRSASFAFDVSESENFEFVFADVLDDVNISADSLDNENFVFSHLLIRDILFLLVSFISSATSSEIVSFRTKAAKMFISSDLLFSKT